MPVYICILIWLVLRAVLNSSEPPIDGGDGEIRRRQRQRLGILREQAATYGIDVPAHIQSEIDDLETELETVNVLEQNAFGETTRKAVKRFDARELIMQVRADLSKRIRALEEGIGAIRSENRADAEQRHKDRSRGSFIMGVLVMFMLLILILVIILLAIGLR